MPACLNIRITATRSENLLPFSIRENEPRYCGESNPGGEAATAALNLPSTLLRPDTNHSSMVSLLKYPCLDNISRQNDLSHDHGYHGSEHHLHTQQASSKLGLDSDSRLHHMLNAFAGIGGESSDQPVGRSQMTVAMAFSTFEQFKVNDRMESLLRLNPSPLVNSVDLHDEYELRVD